MIEWFNVRSNGHGLFSGSIWFSGSVCERGLNKMARVVMGAIIAVSGVWVAVVGVPLGIWIYLSEPSLTTKKGGK